MAMALSTVSKKVQNRLTGTRSPTRLTTGQPTIHTNNMF